MIIINTQCAAVCGREPSRIRTTWKREHIIVYTNLNILYYYYTRLFTASDDENSCKHMRTHTNHSAWSRRSVRWTGWKQKTVLVEHEREGQLYSFLTTIRPNRWLVEMLPVYYVMYKYRVHVYSVRENANETIGTQGMHIHCTHTHTHTAHLLVLFTHSLGQDFASGAQNGTDGKPQTVEQRHRVLQRVVSGLDRMRLLPFERCHSENISTTVLQANGRPRAITRVRRDCTRIPCLRVHVMIILRVRCVTGTVW